jgi:Fe(3+) dicitrate transport protein
VEYAPSFINRSGISVGYKKLKLNVLESYTGRSFGDAGNTKTSTEDAVVGIIPKFWVMDISGQVSLKTLTLKGSINNLLDRSYFTLRTPEYPGPGIIPSQKRSFVFSLSKTW